jgi:broad specificity phosphatase PhoE
LDFGRQVSGLQSKRTLVLVKHSEPILEPGLAPNRWRLSERGRSRSVLLGERLAQYGPGVMVSSGEPKAVETAGISAGRLGIGCFVYPGLHEHDRTNVPFLGDEEFGRAARGFFENQDRLVWGNETAEEAGGRFEGAVRGVLDEREEEVVAMVVHGTVISLLVAQHNNIDAHELWRSLGLPSFCVLSVPGFELEEACLSLMPRT